MSRHKHVALRVSGFVNRRLAYVAVSRGRLDAQIYTIDTAHLAQALSRDGGHRSAMEPSLPPAALSESLKTFAQDQVVQQTITQVFRTSDRPRPSLFYESRVLEGGKGLRAGWNHDYRRGPGHGRWFRFCLQIR
jgi:hypothetical protein